MRRYNDGPASAWKCAIALETGQRPGGPLAQEQVEQQQVGVDAVALGQVHPEPEPAGLLGAHHRAGLDHLRPDELEPDRASRRSVIP